MKWNLEKRKIKELHEYAKNPRQLHKYEAAHLQESLSKFGLCEPIVINRDGTIIGGHQRVRTLRKMGYKEVDVYIPDIALKEKEFAELNIRLNKNIGSWDFDMLANAWDPIDLVDWGFTPEELHLDELPDIEGEGEDATSSESCTMNIHFKKPEDLQEAENKIRVIVDGYEGAHCAVKVK